MGRSINDVQRGLSTAPTGVDTYEARAVLTQRMERILKLRTDVYIADDEERRLVALRLRLEAELAGPRRNPGLLLLGGSFDDRPRVDHDRLVAAMVDAEIDRMRALAEKMSPPPPSFLPYLGEPVPGMLDTRGIAADWGSKAAAYERNEIENYLLEIGQAGDAAHAEGCARLRWPGPDCPPRAPSSSPATVDLYQEYIGGPFQSTVSRAVDEVPALVSLMLDFVPFIGQVKGIIESITGKDLITKRQLADWERGLNALLALIPSARGIFKAGKTGVRTLAAVALKSGRPADEIYRVMKGASELTEAEVRAARQLVNGKPVHPAAFEKVAGSLDEMTGAKPKGSRAQSFRVASGVIEDGRGLSRSVASSPIQVPKKLPGKVVKATKTAPELASRLVKNGITSKAIEALERAGVKVTDNLATVLINTRAGGFVNAFHQCPGFELVVKDLVGQASKRKGAALVVEFVTDVTNKIDPRLVKFELPAGITKIRTLKKSQDVASRLTDLVITVGGRPLNYEFKAYSKASLAFWARRDPIQLVKDLKMLGRQHVRWVFDSRAVSRSYVYKKLKKAIKNDPILAKEFGKGAQLEKGLDELVVMYPPVPKPLPAIPLQGTVKPFANDDEKERRQ